MTVTRIVKLVDGEELVSIEGRERVSSATDDPRRGALERRQAAEFATSRNTHPGVKRQRLF